MTEFTLNNGLKMPKFGLGTYNMDPKTMVDTIEHAIVKQNVRHLDTASFYHNEEAIGEALQKVFKQGIKRSDLFITTKVWNDDRGNVI